MPRSRKPASNRGPARRSRGGRGLLISLLLGVTAAGIWWWIRSREPAPVPSASPTGNPAVGAPPSARLAPQIAAPEPSATFAPVTAHPLPPSVPVPAPDLPTAPLSPPIPEPARPMPFLPRIATNMLEVQIVLARHGIGSGSIDGVGGAQTEAALRAFQYQQGLDESGRLDRDTARALQLERPPLQRHQVTAEDAAPGTPVPDTWLAKSRLKRLDYASPLERLAERTHAHPKLLRRLNPGVDWDSLVPGTRIEVPDAAYPPPRRAALIRISLAGRYLRAYDDEGHLLVHFPVSIGRLASKRPVGSLSVVVVIKDPDYTFNPEVFPESEEGRRLGRRLLLPPGPNNPVGVAWIGLSRPGYGIHGTPSPEQVGRTESHGCFRLANWDADHLRRMVLVGTRVNVEP
ncbi:MAG: L,D-transpeptidase family protein [Verrucomicrobiae bacterium]|nr:L,D-transpeptidase family protein [Verrucomicrobiae bacterium]